MQEPVRRCAMCLRRLTISRPRTGRIPTFCPECARRRHAEKSRLNMARMRARKRRTALAR